MKHFAPFTLDTGNYVLRRGAEPIALTPKAYSVLRHLVDNAGRLVTKQELLDAVWPETFIQEGVLKSCILEIRKALGDSAETPRYIQTHHRRGYRFVAAVTEEKAPDAAPAPRTAGLIGREAELALLRNLLRRAAGGRRQVLFIAGEPGIGKTTLVEHFALLVWAEGLVRVAKGNCLEYFGEREPYYPVLDAVSRAARQWGGDELASVLRQTAPSWLCRIPSLAAGNGPATVREGMGREMGEALETLARQRPVVLTLEDLQWSDHWTLDLISWIASRTEEAELLLIGTYRPAEVTPAGHPFKKLKQELLARGLCSEWELKSFSLGETAEFVRYRMPENDFSDEFIGLLQDHTDGNPMFLASVIDEAAARGLVAEKEGRWTLAKPLGEIDLGTPENVMQLIERQLDRLTEKEQALLEAASVAGVEFAVSWLVVDDGDDALAVEARCEGLARRKLFLRRAGSGEFPEGATGTRYRFLHRISREVIYRRLSPGRRMQLHRSIGSLGQKSSGTNR